MYPLSLFAVAFAATVAAADNAATLLNRNDRKFEVAGTDTCVIIQPPVGGDVRKFKLGDLSSKCSLYLGDKCDDEERVATYENDSDVIGRARNAKSIFCVPS